MKFAVLGEAEACTGDPARRLGNEFVFQMLAQQNVETLNEAGADRRIVATCPHCFNSLAREYPQLGGNYEVVHHTQLLDQLVERGPAHPGHPDRRAGHLPRPVLPRPAQQGLHPAARDPRHGARPAHRRRCTGARSAASAAAPAAPGCGWRRRSASGSTSSGSTRRSALDPDIVSTACPFCLVMLGDAVTAKKQDGSAREDVEVLDVSQLLLRSVRRNITVVPGRRRPGAPVRLSGGKIVWAGSAPIAARHGRCMNRRLVGLFLPDTCRTVGWWSSWGLG